MSALSPVDMYRLNLACVPIVKWLGVPYLVGSAMQRKKRPRDVDVRVILTDREYDRLADVHDHHESVPLLLNLAVSAYLRDMTGLPIDFQVQRHTEANQRHDGPRRALGVEFRLGADGRPNGAST